MYTVPPNTAMFIDINYRYIVINLKFIMIVMKTLHSTRVSIGIHLYLFFFMACSYRFNTEKRRAEKKKPRKGLPIYRRGLYYA